MRPRVLSTLRGRPRGVAVLPALAESDRPVPLRIPIVSRSTTYKLPQGAPSLSYAPHQVLPVRLSSSISRIASFASCSFMAMNGRSFLYLDSDRPPHRPARQYAHLRTCTRTREARRGSAEWLLDIGYLRELIMKVVGYANTRVGTRPRTRVMATGPK